MSTRYCVECACPAGWKRRTDTNELPHSRLVPLPQVASFTTAHIQHFARAWISSSETIMLRGIRSRFGKGWVGEACNEDGLDPVIKTFKPNNLRLSALIDADVRP